MCACSSRYGRPEADFHECDNLLAIECLNRFKNYFLTTTAQTVRFVRAVNHPACKVMYDSFHAHIKRMSSLFDWQKAESREPEH
ncbi:MAG: TIM barrel protein [Isosphaeraceae bacterium]